MCRSESCEHGETVERRRQMRQGPPRAAAPRCAARYAAHAPAARRAAGRRAPGRASSASSRHGRSVRPRRSTCASRSCSNPRRWRTCSRPIRAASASSALSRRVRAGLRRARAASGRQPPAWRGQRSRPRAARLRISAPAPNVHGSHWSVGRMRFTRLPNFGAAMVTMSPDLWVKPWPGASRSSTGANMVPRNSTAPSG